jgi:hypothetical protein
VNAALWHKAQKAARLAQAEHDAKQVVDRLDMSNDLLELAFAMLYLGEGKKSGTTALASSDPKILQFSLAVLNRVYGIHRNTVRTELHLRSDQNEDKMKQYWSAQLGIPLSNFNRSSFDHRTTGRATHSTYKGVCVLNCGNIAIQRKLSSLYNLFCERVQNLAGGD